MGLFQRLMAVAGYERRADDPRYWGADPAISVAGTSVTAESALQYGIVQSVLEVLGGTISTLPMMVYKRGKDGARAPAPNHPLYRLLHGQPSDRAGAPTSQEFRDEFVRHLAYWRNAYARIIPGNDYAIGGLEIIHPERVTKVERLDDGHIVYTISGLGLSPQFTLRDDQIWHVRKAPLTVDGLRGRPVFETGREEIGRALAVEYYGSRYFRNSGKSGGILEHPGSFKTEDDRRAFLAAWRDRSTGDMQHSDRLLTHGVKYVPQNVQNDEAQFIETIKQVEVKVARLWQMPPHRVGILDRATNNNIESQGIDFVVYALAPWIVALEQAAARDLLIGEDRDNHFVEFNVAGLLRGDIKARYEAYSRGRQWGWLSVNDIRRLENMEPLGGEGDRYLEPENMRAPGEKTDAP